ncbi:hypothetical protein TWF696_000277 [Orbilia brochopaga]|uniref:Uncharacterized protein n=1 Tax=Orbilia brochopaga TaxID=3140254 RepID=A0AAV9VH72_9PEZI
MAQATQKTQQVYELKNVPTSGHWVTFITEPSTRIPLTWSEWSGTIRRGTYYNCRAYWGMCESSLDPSQLITDEDEQTKSSFRKPKWLEGNKLSVILGETQLFIAAEYIDKEYRDGPSAPYHIKDLVKWNDAHGPTWITMQLNGVFQYGQNNGVNKSSKMNRWLVYHPPISRMIEPPRVFQHRFTGTLKTDLVEAGIRDMHLAVESGEDHKVAAQATGKVLSILIKLVRNGVGHYLHTFLSTQDVNDIIVTKFNQLRAKNQVLQETALYTTVMQDIQFWEKKEADKERDAINSKMADAKKASDNYEKMLLLDITNKALPQLKPQTPQKQEKQPETLEQARQQLQQYTLPDIPHKETAVVEIEPFNAADPKVGTEQFKDELNALVAEIDEAVNGTQHKRDLSGIGNRGRRVIITKGQDGRNAPTAAYKEGLFPSEKSAIDKRNNLISGNYPK